MPFVQEPTAMEGLLRRAKADGDNPLRDTDARGERHLKGHRSGNKACGDSTPAVPERRGSDAPPRCILTASPRNVSTD